MKTISKFIIKLILLLITTLFTLINYRILSLDKGWSIVNINNFETITAVELIKDIPTKIEYYKKTIIDNEYDYKIYIETNNKNYLFDTTFENIQTLDIIGLFAKDIKPIEIKPIPFYIEIIIGFLIIIIPFGEKLENKNSNETTDELQRYKKLLDENIITKEEFEEKKKQILNL